jgi:hypothetical protein
MIRRRDVLRLAAGILVLAARAAVAQQTPAPLPPGPLIQKRAPNMAFWSVTIKYGSLSGVVFKTSSTPAKDKTDKAQDIKINIVKTNEITLVQRVDQADQAWNTWCLPSLQILVWSDGKTCSETGAPNQDLFNPFYNDFSKTDFQGFDWISRENYAGSETLMGFNCIVFKDASRVAYVETQSRLPVARVDAGQVFIYEWKAPPQAALTLPPNVQALVTQRLKAMQQMAQPAARPF